MRALVTLRDTPAYRRDSFLRGLQNAGYSVVDAIPDPTQDDVLVIWNRTGPNAEKAAQFERAGGTVLVAENGYMGREWSGHVWYAISISQHNGAGRWPDSNGARWAKYGFELAPYRDGQEIVLLPQRGIGPLGVAMPRFWDREISQKIKCRVRPHPGINPCKPLAEDLATARAVLTWGSGAAIKAMAMGIPVFYAFNRWIARDGGTYIDHADFDNPQRPDRYQAFCKVFDAMWRLDEIETGETFIALRCVK